MRKNMVPSDAGHHENSEYILEFKGKPGADVAPGFHVADEARPTAKGVTSNIEELLSKTSLSCMRRNGARAVLRGGGAGDSTSLPDYPKAAASGRLKTGEKRPGIPLGSVASISEYPCGEIQPLEPGRRLPDKQGKNRRPGPLPLLGDGNPLAYNFVRSEA